MKEVSMSVCYIPSHLKEFYRNFLFASEKLQVKKNGVLNLLKFTVLLDLMIASVVVYITLIDPNEL